MLAAAPDRLAVDVADAQALKAKAASGDKAALAGAARQFESMMVAQMLKTMRQARFNDEDDPMNGGPGMKLYQDLLDQQWAGQITKGRGLGFAEMMVQAMTASSKLRVESSESRPAGAQPVISAEASPSAPGDIQPTTSSHPQLATRNSQLATDFLERMRPHAEAASAATGVPTAFILGHAALESGWGRHEIKGADGQASRNLFGIKAGRGWDGDVAETLTTEYRQGVPMKLAQRFRAYDDYAGAFTDYARLLKARYGPALEGGADASAFARGLAAGGYATDPRYADKLQSVIASVAMAGV